MNVYQQISRNKRRTVLLIIIFIILLALIGLALSWFTEQSYFGLAIALLIALPLSLFSYYSGDKVALWTAGAQGPLRQADNPYVFRLVENLCLTAGLPQPKIYLIPDPAPNAFATGRDPQHSSLALTTGLVEKLENEELEGVIAHELSHIKNYDIRLMMVVIVCVGLITLLTDFTLRFSFFGGQRRSSRSGQLDLIFLVLGLVALILSPLVARLIMLAISRRREYLADSSAVLLTRYPEGLARALEKIGNYPQPLQRIHQATAHLYISSPFGSSRRFFTKLFSTHPPLAERIKLLRQIA